MELSAFLKFPDNNNIIIEGLVIIINNNIHSTDDAGREIN
jgi:hypothetical protein